MAEKQFARSGGNSLEFFAEDDPLAELARIVGFEPKPVAANDQKRDSRVVSVPSPVAAVTEAAPERVAEQPQHPLFNLEDELTREFERYEAPRREPAVVVDQQSAAVDVRPAVADDIELEPVFAETAVAVAEPVSPVAYDAIQRGEPVFDAPTETHSIEGEADGDLVDDSEFASMFADAEPFDAPEPVAFSAEAIAAVEAEITVGNEHAEAFEQPAVVSDTRDDNGQDTDFSWPVSDAPQAFATDEPVTSAVEPTFSRAEPVDPVFESAEEHFDLAQELEMAIKSAALAPVPAIEPEPAFQVKAQLRPHLPVTNFSVQRSNYRAEPRLDSRPSGVDEGVGGDALEMMAAEMPAVEFDRLADEAPARAFAEPSFSGTIEPAFDETASPADPAFDFAFDADLTAELAPQDSLAASPTTEAVEIPETVSARRVDPFDADDLLADVARYPVPNQRLSPLFDDEDKVGTKNAGKPERSEERQPQPVATLRAPETEQVSVSEKRAEPAFDDPFADQNFDFDFDDIDFDLADLSFDDPEPLAPAVQTRAEEVKPVEEIRQTETRGRAAEPVVPFRVTTKITDLSETPMRQPVARRAEPRVEPDSETVLPFDPSQIAEAEEIPEAIADMDVPSLPVVEPEEKVAHPPEYDIDIDAEMANLFQPIGHAPAVAAKAVPVSDGGFANPAWAVAPNDANPDPVKASFDEFDEFERALEEDFRRTLTQPVEDDASVAKMTLGPNGGYVERAPRRGLSRGLVLSLAMLLVCGTAVGAGAYLYLSGGNETATALTGPRVIVADKEPIKVVPENRGGLTVPNQDKAVYDRVAGNVVEDPKQDSLLSSKEEPIDVVQRTLIPETLPLEGAEDSDDVNPTPVGETEDARLLANETATDTTAETDTTAGVSPRKVRTMIVKSDGTLVPRETIVEETSTAAATDTTERSVLAEPTGTTRSANLNLDNMKPVTQTPVETAQDAAATDATAGQEDAAPVTTDTTDGLADPPVRVVKTTKIDETQVDNTKIDDKAPIPESRPVDQPVNIVGTVTDQGNLRETTNETAAAADTGKKTQVASLQPGSYVMQIASLPSEAEAKKSYASLSSKFGGVIGGRGVDIKKVEVAGKGTFYRVRIPVGSKDDAAALCVKYRAAGGTCLISK